MEQTLPVLNSPLLSEALTTLMDTRPFLENLWKEILFLTLLKQDATDMDRLLKISQLLVVDRNEEILIYQEIAEVHAVE